MKIVSAFLFLTAAEASNNIRGRRKALQLVGYGGEPNANRFPLQLCEGDCDNDAECDVGLVCFQREIPGPGESWAEVPGCTGGRDFEVQTDFCIEAPIAQEAREETQGPTFTPSFTPTMSPTLRPTGMPTTAVPTEDGATTAPTTQMPSAAPSSAVYWDLPEVVYVSDNGNPGGMPLGLCEGDCDADEDCLDELVCFQRNFEEPIPGCRGTGRLSMDYCIKPPIEESVQEAEEMVTMSPTVAATMAVTEMIVALETVGDNVDLALGLCQGDCDTDEDCLDDFICFQRDALEEVPGCSGTGKMSFDYCIINPSTATMAPTEDANMAMMNEVPIVMTVSPTTSLAEAELIAIEAAENTPMLVSVDKNHKGDLGLCEGKCKNDNDCAGDLICLKRDANDGDVPGCGGVPNGGDDYCISP